MRIAKQFILAAPQDAVWQFITDPKRVAPCVPGCTGVEEISAGVYRATIKLQIGPINTSFDVDIQAIELVAPRRAVYSTKGDEGGKASRIKAETTLDLVEVGKGSTQVSYASEVAIVGRLGKFGTGIVQKKADAIGEEFVNSLRTNLEVGQGEAGAAGVRAEEGMGLAPTSSPAAPSRGWLWAVAVLIFAIAMVYLARR